MTKVFLHYRNSPGGDWINEERTFSRLPCVGEYVATDVASAWHRVYLVVHCPFDAEFEAEVYTVAGPSSTEAISAQKPLP
jgi:hypothetical protein